jgi:hypothetical protein
MRKLATLCAALLLAACGQQKLSAAAIRDAMPSSQEVQVGAPNAGQSGAMLLASDAQAKLAGAAIVPHSSYAITSYLFATSINLSVAWTLLRLEAVTIWPPTSCTEHACTWGPGSDAGDVNEWELVVTQANEAYDYSLQGRPKGQPGAAWVPLITGRAYPGASPHRGHGTLSVDFDRAWAGLAPGVNLDGSPRVQKDFGAVEITYDARSELAVQASFVKAKDADRFATDPTARVDVFYDFLASSDGGSLHLAVRTLPLGDTSEAVSLHTRWAAAGNGRGDVEYVGPKAPAGPFHASECWAGEAAGFVLTYDTDPAYGTEAACTGFLTADYLPFPATFP